MPRALRNVDDFRKRAQQVLPRVLFDYIEGGVDDERCLKRNRAAFDEFVLVPKRLRDASVRDLGCELLGARAAAPFFAAPTAFNGLLWPNGDLAVAQACGTAGIPFVLSTASQCPLESVTDAVCGERWFQLYVTSASTAASLVSRAEAAGYRALILTVDVPVNGHRERDLRNGFRLPVRWAAEHPFDALSHLGWLCRYLRRGSQQLPNLATSSDTAATADIAALTHRRLAAALSWSYLEQLRARWPRRLIVKGILNRPDIDRCFAVGVDAVILSNHGGRQLDCADAPVAVLDAVAARRDGDILIDSGFRRGSDIVKAVGLGARAAGLGRAVLYGLAVGGSSGVSDVLSLLRDEMDNTLAQIGCASVSELNASYVAHRGGRASTVAAE